MTPRTAALLLAPAIGVATVLFVAPVAFLVSESAHRFSLTGAVGALTAANYVKLLTDSYYLALLAETCKLAALTALICLVLGMPVAWCIRLARPRVRGVLLLALLAPLLVSVVVRSFGWIVILGEFGLLNAGLGFLGVPSGSPLLHTHLFTEAAVLAGLVHVFFPFMVLALLGSIQKIDLRLLQAARSLGAGRARAFRAIAPLTLPGVVAGVTTVFALATGSYVTVAVLGGTGVRVLAVVAYEQAVSGMNWPFGAAIGVLLLATTTIALRLFEAAVARAMPP
jgi:putative spermidine/putrescine transport system permease protein